MRPSASTHIYEQDEDSAGRTSHDSQQLEIEVTDAGGGPYIVIKTERWALEAESIDAFADELKARLSAIPDAGAPT